MAEVINLNRARKTRAKAAQAAGAMHNRAKFGRTKAEAAKTRAEAEKLGRVLDDARRDDPARDD